jgi:hypothetical protein
MKRPVLHLTEAALAYWAMRVVLQYPTIGWTVATWLPAIGTAVVLASLVLLVVDLLAVVPPETFVGDVLARIGRYSRWIVVVFVWIAIVLAFNAWFDRSGITVHRATVVSVGTRTLTAGTALVHSWMDVRSTTLQEGTVRIPLGPAEQGVFWREEPVLVSVRAGCFGLPWVSRLDRDLEQHYRSVLAKLPGAPGPSQALVAFLVDHMRWDEARDEAQRYLAAHPDDVEFALYAGGNMSVRGWLDASAAMLELAVNRSPERHLLGRLAWVEARRGNWAQAIRFAEAGEARYPDAWEFPLVLGYTFTRQGDECHAAAAFALAAKLQPGIAEVDRALGHLRAEAQSCGQ